VVEAVVGFRVGGYTPTFAQRGGREDRIIGPGLVVGVGGKAVVVSQGRHGRQGPRQHGEGREEIGGIFPVCSCSRRTRQQWTNTSVYIRRPSAVINRDNSDSSNSKLNAQLT
jgi:hypothetical protein